MTEPNDPRVTRALEAFGANDVEGLRMFALNNPMVREAMARALDAADEPLPVRDVSRGTKTFKEMADEVAWIDEGIPYTREVPTELSGHRSARVTGPVGSCGIPGCLTHPPVQSSVPRHARGQQIQRVWTDEVSSVVTADIDGFTEYEARQTGGRVDDSGVKPSPLDRLRNRRRRAR